MFLAALRRRFALVLVSGFGLFAPASAQHAPAQLDSAQILHRIERLEVLGSGLYIAAHSDDENTRVISYFAQPRVLPSGEVQP